MKISMQEALARAETAYASGKNKEAISIYRAIIVGRPRNFEANFNLGKLLLKFDAEEAVRYIKISLEISPQNKHVLKSLVLAYIQLGETKNAEKFLGLALEKYENDRDFANLQRKLDKGGTTTQTETTIAAKASTNPSSLTKTKKVKKLKETFVAKSYDKTIKLAKSIVENDSGHLLSWQLLGASYQSIGNRSAALAAYEQALAICPGDAASVCNMAILHLELKDISQAQLGFQKALSLKSNWSVAQNGLGSTYLALGDNSNAEKCFLTALTLEPNYYDALVSLGALYKEKGRAKESEEYLRKAISIQPGLPFAKYSLGILLKHMGKFEAAITLLDGLDYKDSEQTLVMCLYLSGKKEQFRERLELSIKRGEVNTIVGSLGSRAEARYRWDKPNLFCKEPLDYVDKTSLLGKCDFNKLFVRPALDILGTAASKEHQSILTNGLQTAGNIFELEKDLMSPVEEIIRSEVQLYLEKHCESEEGLMRHWPSHYSLYGWFISMQRGGALDAHIHESGWVSGCVYINVPPKKAVDSGNLVVCTEDTRKFNEVGPDQKKTVDVLTGDICLFPASLMHYTIPFDSSEDRIVLAFDVKPS